VLFDQDPGTIFIGRETKADCRIRRFLGHAEDYVHFGRPEPKGLVGWAEGSFMIDFTWPLISRETEFIEASSRGGDGSRAPEELRRQEGVHPPMASAPQYC
jgi:hypothetical protein